MATAWVQGAFAFTDSATLSQAVAFGSNVTANGIIAVFVKAAAWTSIVVSDSQGNTYTAVDSTTGNASNTNKIATFWARAGSSAACTVTATLTGGGGFPRVMVHEGSGCDTTPSVLNAHEIASQGPFNNNVSTTDLVSSAGSAVTTVNGCLILGIMVEHTGAEVFVAGTGFTLRTAGATPGNNFDVLYSESLIQGAAGSVHGTFSNSNTLGTGKYFTAAMLALQPPQAASAPTKSLIVSRAGHRAASY